MHQMNDAGLSTAAPPGTRVQFEARESDNGYLAVKVHVISLPELPKCGSSACTTNDSSAPQFGFGNMVSTSSGRNNSKFRTRSPSTSIHHSPPAIVAPKLAEQPVASHQNYVEQPPCGDGYAAVVSNCAASSDTSYEAAPYGAPIYHTPSRLPKLANTKNFNTASSAETESPQQPSHHSEEGVGAQSSYKFPPISGNSSFFALGRVAKIDAKSIDGAPVTYGVFQCPVEAVPVHLQRYCKARLKLLFVKGVCRPPLGPRGSHCLPAQFAEDLLDLLAADDRVWTRIELCGDALKITDLCREGDCARPLAHDVDRMSGGSRPAGSNSGPMTLPAAWLAEAEPCELVDLTRDVNVFNLFAGMPRMTANLPAVGAVIR